MLNSDYRSFSRRMSDPESSSSYFGLEDPQWLCMVTLFIASLVTLILYFVQYFQHRVIGNKQGAAEGDNAATEEEEAAALLGWALSLKSWKSQWRRAWCIALNDEARKRKGAVLLAFEEDGLEASDLTLSRVSSFQKSAGNKVLTPYSYTGKHLCTVYGRQAPTC